MFGKRCSLCLTTKYKWIKIWNYKLLTLGDNIILLLFNVPRSEMQNASMIEDPVIAYGLNS